MKILAGSKYGDFLQAIKLYNVPEEKIEECLNVVKGFALADSLMFRMPKLTFNQYEKICNFKTIGDYMVKGLHVIHGLNSDQIKNLKTFDALRFFVHLREECTKIEKVLKEIKLEPTPEEVKVGADQVNHGLTGVKFWYAKEMGLTSIDLVDDVRFEHIIALMKITNENIMIQRRINKLK